jgi:hypothetical protein
MTVAQLVEKLKALPQDLPVYLDDDGYPSLVDGAAATTIFKDEWGHFWFRDEVDHTNILAVVIT